MLFEEWSELACLTRFEVTSLVTAEELRWLWTYPFNDLCIGTDEWKVDPRNNMVAFRRRGVSSLGELKLSSALSSLTAIRDFKALIGTDPLKELINIHYAFVPQVEA